MGTKAKEAPSEYPPEMATWVDRYVALRASNREYEDLGKKIKTALTASTTKLFTSPAGHVATLSGGSPGGTGTRLVWCLEKCKKFFSRALFARCFPPAPDSVQLAAAAATDPGLATKCQISETFTVPGKAPSLNVIEAKPA